MIYSLPAWIKRFLFYILYCILSRSDWKSVHIYYFLKNFYVNDPIATKYKENIWGLVITVCIKNKLDKKIGFYRFTIIILIRAYYWNQIWKLWLYSLWDQDFYTDGRTDRLTDRRTDGLGYIDSALEDEPGVCLTQSFSLGLNILSWVAEGISC